MEYTINKYSLNKTVRLTDHVIINNDNSINSIIKNMEKLFIKEQGSLKIMIFIFLYNNEAFHKKFFIDNDNKNIILKSDNKNYDDIILDI